jgi:hypothetical protein
MVIRNTVALSCALAGGIAGYFGFVALLQYGFYALALPGGLVGLLGGVVATRSRIVSVACGVMGVAAGVLTEHRHAPFIADTGLAYFVAHAADLPSFTLVQIAAGGLIAFWVPFRRRISKREESA